MKRTRRTTRFDDHCDFLDALCRTEAEEIDFEPEYAIELPADVVTYMLAVELTPRASYRLREVE